jgi:protein-L-isoaspartate(D-aspartate) O-methyltransferase
MNGNAFTPNQTHQGETMSQFANARRTMLDNQIRTSDVTELRLLASLGAVPRERFVAADLRPLAYTDHVLRLTEGTPGRWLMTGASLAKLVQLAEIAETEKVLVIGSGSGYSVAVIAPLAASVIGLEEDETLAAASQVTLTELAIPNVSIVRGPLAAGHAAAQPYDVILMEGAVDDIPSAIPNQLAEGGRLIAVEGRGAAAFARIYVKSGGLVTGRDAFNCAAKPLPGFERKPEFVF